MRSVFFFSEQKKSDVFVERGILFNIASYPKNLKLAIVTDHIVEKLYGEELLSFLQENGREAYLFSFQAGEENKNRHTKETLEDAMQTIGLGKDTCLIALGGGVATDIGGYIASTYCRGIPLILVPTTLLGMVDAALGGKNGVNTSKGKNLIGTIYQPNSILIDLDTLQTLALQEIRNGIAEVIKHALIADLSLFTFLQKNREDLLRLEDIAVREVILKSIQIKQSVVEADEKESGKRHILNFGHTVAHALEFSSNYEIPHGECVAIGCIAESFLSFKMGLLPKESVSEIKEMFKAYGFPIHKAKNHSFSDLEKGFAYDKKSLGSIPRFVLLEQIGGIKDSLSLANPQHLIEMWHDLHTD